MNTMGAVLRRLACWFDAEEFTRAVREELLVKTILFPAGTGCVCACPKHRPDSIANVITTPIFVSSSSISLLSSVLELAPRPKAFHEPFGASYIILTAY